MANFVTKDFSNLMMNWMEVLNSASARFNIAESSKPSDSTTLKLPSAASSDNETKKLPKQSTSKSKRKPKKKGVKKPTKSKGDLLPIFEMSTNVSNDLILELQHGNEGFDLHIGQTVCDDSRPTMGEEAQSYFLMRHSFTYPGPLMTMLQGPMAAVTGGYGYRISAEAVHRDKYVLVGTYSNNTVEGVWEHTWNKNIKSHLTFVAGFESAQQRQMAALMAQQQGMPPQSESKFPAAISYIDYRGNNWSSRLHLDMMNNQLSLSFNRRVYSISKDFQVGARIVSSYEKRKSLLEFGGRYQWRSAANQHRMYSASSTEKEGEEAEKKSAAVSTKKTKSGLNTVEAMYSLESSTLQLFYTKHITDNAALTSRLMWKTSTWSGLMASIGYRYQFGRHMGMSKTISGEIAADGNFRQMITFPVLGNMICKLYAEINHFLTPQQLQQGQFPHKFGIQLNIHL
eukprot:CAMPEP_0197080580 /NCGR_PEP_ID=MMETSP1384-20130603/214200_1 /TAXON_ID=29189 /ORGANISM="Ammonia sp." /LENGTH=455 /DNA_ID=CAMNT_0042519467 /DNA_START=28 /DNA_END=1395 /DNA_ORIENTATION=+